MECENVSRRLVYSDVILTWIVCPKSAYHYSKGLERHNIEIESAQCTIMVYNFLFLFINLKP